MIPLSAISAVFTIDMLNNLSATLLIAVGMGWVLWAAEHRNNPCAPSPHYHHHQILPPLTFAAATARPCRRCSCPTRPAADAPLQLIAVPSCCHIDGRRKRNALSGLVPNLFPLQEMDTWKFSLFCYSGADESSIIIEGIQEKGIVSPRVTQRQPCSTIKLTCNVQCRPRCLSVVPLCAVSSRPTLQTLTTVGYGDMCPSTGIGKLIASFWMVRTADRRERGGRGRGAIIALSRNCEPECARNPFSHNSARRPWRALPFPNPLRSPL